MLPITAHADPDNSWNYDTVLDGAVSKDVTTPGLTDITVTGGNGYVAGNADIYTGHVVNVTGDDGATFAYRDNRSNIESTLNGELNSNMRIVVIDKDGVFFENGASVDVQSLVATSAYVGVADVMDGGDLKFYGVKHGGDVVNEGTITVAEAGLAAFVAPHAANHGTINAVMGNVVMAAGKKVTLDLYGDGLVEVEVQGKLKDALLENTGTIDAQGGNVQITAKAAKDTLDTIINNEGIINASSATVEGGKIILSGGRKGKIRNAGQIETSEGGSVEIKGQRFVQEADALAPVLAVAAFVAPPAVDPAIITDGGDVDIETKHSVQIIDGVVDARATAPENEGGNINIANGGAFYSGNENTLKTNQGGTIEVNQNKSDYVPDTIQNVIDAIDNSGDGTNTINVSAGEFNEAVVIDHDNVVLNGANAGTPGSSFLRGPETVIVPNSPGIHVVADNAVINGVVVDGGDPGIFVDNVDNVSILNSIIKNSTTHGVHLVNAANAVLQGNKIYDIVQSGIHAVNAANILVGGYGFGEGNKILNTFTGIRLINVDNAQVIANYVKNTGDDAVDIDNSEDVVISYNVIKNAGTNTIHGDGIELTNSGGAQIMKNFISDVSSDLIEVTNSPETEIEYNILTGAGNNGVFMVDSRNSDVENNIISHVTRDAAKIINGTLTNVAFNLIKYVEGNGVYIEGGRRVNATDNKLWHIDNDAIFITDSEEADVKRNVIKYVDGNGIVLDQSDEANIEDNTLYKIALDGIKALYSTDADIERNTLTKVGGNGVYGEGLTSADIKFNDIKWVGMNGIGLFGGSILEVNNNTISKTLKDGIYATDISKIELVLNNIKFAFGDGLQLNNSTNAKIENNVIGYNWRHGVYVSGEENGTVVFQENTLTNNGLFKGLAAARFESGAIDMSDLTDPNMFVNTTGIPSTAMQFENISGDTNELTIVEETIGSTIFDGYLTDGSFYVRFENGAILDPVTNLPILIDGRFASFDGVVPNLIGPVLPPATLAFIEDRLFDADDPTVDGRGQIFLQLPPEEEEALNGLTNFQDFLQEKLDDGNEGDNFASVIIQGLPPIGDLPVSTNLNNIAPAAGGEPTAEDLANINPAAGDEDGAGNGVGSSQQVTCLDAAVNSLGSGSVTYNFGGSFEDSIAAQSECETTVSQAL